MNVSIIIPNLHSPIIDQTLEGLEAQELDPRTAEIIVIGQDKFDLVHDSELIRFIRTPQPASPAVARNIGIRLSRGELICLIDADCIPAPGWLLRLTEAFENPNIYVVGGGVAFDVDSYWTLCDNLSWFHDYLASTGEGERLLLPSLNLCIRRSALEKAGLFNEEYPRAAGEDAEWTTRIREAGYTLHFLPDAKVHHYPSRASLREVLHHAYTYGRYSIKVNPSFAGLLGIPLFLRKWWLVLALTPLLAALSTLRIYLADRAVWHYWYAAPGILISKAAWCWGAARTLCLQDTPGRGARAGLP